MFDEEQNLLAEHIAERELYLRQMEETQTRTEKVKG